MVAGKADYYNQGLHRPAERQVVEPSRYAASSLSMSGSLTTAIIPVFSDDARPIDIQFNIPFEAVDYGITPPRTPYDKPSVRAISGGATYANSGASSRLSSALSLPVIAHTYNNSQALRYVWNGVKYAAYAQTTSASLQVLVQAAADAHQQINGTKAMATIDTANPAIAHTLLNPIAASSIDIKPTNQGVWLYYNTASVVMLILQQLFFIMALKGLTAEFGVFRIMSLRSSAALLLGLSVLYTFVGSLCMTGYVWGFRETWAVSGGPFALTWMAIWLVMHLHFLLIDAVTNVLPMKFMPFAILTWIIVNVSRTIEPFDLSPGFYRLGYALPAYELYQLLLDIWTEGCNPPLYRALPILFARWVAGFVAFMTGMRKRVFAARGNYVKSDVTASA